MYFKKFVFLLVFAVLSASAALGVQVKGIVRDGEGEALPYVRISVENSTYGVVSNLKGEFFMELEPGKYNLVFSTLGYQKKTQPVEVIAGMALLEVTLEPEGLEVETVTVTADRRDPAYAIIEKVVDNKHRYLRQFESLKTETYLKVVLEADTVPKKTSRRDSLKALEDSVETAQKEKEKEKASQDTTLTERQKKKLENKNKANPGAPDLEAPLVQGRERLNFMEQVAETWYRFPHQYKEVVLALKDYTEKFGNDRPGVYISYEGEEDEAPPGGYYTINPYLFKPTVSQSDFNFYRNTIEFERLGEQPFISPISSSGKVYYKYHLEESFMENGMVIHKIQVIPREWEGPMFEGYIYVVADLWCLKSVDLKVQPSAMNFYNYFEIIHDYERIDTTWVLTREEYFYNLNEGKRKFYGNTIALHKNHVINPEIPTRFFVNELRRTEDEALTRDSTWWQEARPVSLKPDETKFILAQDSLREIWYASDSVAKRDSAYNRVTIWEVLLSGVGFHWRQKGITLYFNSLLESVQLFAPGGYRQGLGGSFGKEFKKGYVMNVRGDVNYGFLNKDLRGQGQLGFTYLPKHFGRAYIGYGNVFAMLNPYAAVTSFLARGNYVNKIHYSIGQEYEISNGFFADVELRRVEFRSIADLQIEQWTDSLFGSANEPIEFDPYEESQINIKLTLTPFQKYYTEPYRKIIVGSKWPTFTLKYNKSIPSIAGSDLNFDKFEIEVNHNFKVGNLGESFWNASVGSFLNRDSVMVADFKYFRGSDPFWFTDPLKSFQLQGPSLSTTNPFLTAHYMHNFYGLLFNKIPVVKKLKIMAVAGGSLLAVADSEPYLYAEAWGGLQLPFRIKQQRMAFGAYYATSVSTTVGQTWRNQLKFNLIYYEPFRGRWMY